MANGIADGAIVITTKILEDGFKIGLSSMKKQLGVFGKDIDKTLDSTVSKVERLGKMLVGAFAVGKLVQLGKEAIALGSDLEEMNGAVNNVFPNMSKQIDEWSKNTIEAYGLTENEAKGFIKSFGTLAKSMGVAEKQAYDMSTELVQLTVDAASFFNLSESEAASRLNAVFTGNEKAMRDFGITMNKATLDSYALANGFGKTTEAMNNQELATLRLAYVKEQLADASGDFARSQDSWANQTKILTANINQLKATIGQGLINLFAPVIKGLNTLMSYLHTAARAFSTFTATLMGKKAGGGGGGGTAGAASTASNAVSNLADNTSKAAKATDDYAKAQKNANKAATTYLSVLDEVNRFTSDKDSGSDSSPSGGSGGGVGDAANIPAQLDQIYDDSAFAVDDIAGEFSEFAQKLRDAFLAGDWEGLGKIVGEKINEVLAVIKEKISWENVGPTITKITDAITRTFNSLVRAIDWDLLGRTVATGINTLVYTLDQLIDGIDWVNLGWSFAEGVNGLVDEVDWVALGNLIGDRLMITWNMFLGFVLRLDWKKLGTNLQTMIQSAVDAIDTDVIYLTMSGFGIGLADFLNGLISPEIFDELGTLISDGLNAQLAFLDNFGEHFNFANFGDSIASGINAVFIKYDWEKLGAVLGLFAKNILRTLSEAASKIQWKNIGSHIADGINKFFQEFQFTELADTANVFLEGILDGIIALGEEIGWEDIGDNIGDGVKKFLEDFDALTELAVAFRIFVNGIFSAMTSFFLKVNFGSVLEVVKTKLSTALSEIHFDEIGTEIINTIWTALNGDKMTEEQKKNVLSSFSALESTLSTISNFVFTNAENFYNNFLQPVAGWVLGDGLPELARVISEVLDRVSWDEISSGLSDIYNIGGQFAIGFGEGLLGFIEKLANFLTDAFNGAVTVLGPALETISTALGGEGKDGSTAEKVGNAIGYVVGAIAAAKITMTAAKAIGTLASGLPSLVGALAGNPVAIIAIGAGLGLALESIINSGVGEGHVSENIKATSDAIGELKTSLSEEKIKGEADYKYINEVLTKYLELNDKLLVNGSLSSKDQTLFEYYAQQLADYSEPIAKAIGDIGTAYTGTAGELQKLIDLQHEQYKNDLYQQYLTKYYGAIAEQEVNIEVERERMKRRIISAIGGTLNEIAGKGYDVEKMLDEYILMMERTGGVAENTSTELGWITSALKDNGEWLESGSNVWRDHAASIDAANESISLANYEIELIQPAMENAAKTAGEAADAAMKASEDAANKVKENSEETQTELGETEISSEEFASGYEENAERVGTASEEMRKGVGDATQGINDDLNAHENDGSNFITRLFGFASESARGEGHVFTEVVGEVLKTNKDNLDDHSEDGKPYGDSMIGSIITGVKGRWESLKQGMRDTAAAASGAYADEMGIANGSSSVMEGVGKDTISGIEEGSGDETPNLLATFEELPDKMVKIMGDLTVAFRKVGGAIINGTKLGILLDKRGLLSDLGDLSTKMVAKFDGLNASMWAVGHNAMQNLANGIRSVHIPRPVFGVGTSWANAAGVAFPIPNVNVTWMASGGVIPKNSAKFLAGLGDNNHETEVVSPISTMKQAFTEALMDAGIAGGGSRTTSVKVQINRRTVYEEMMSEARERMDRTGVNPFDLGTT